MKQQRTRQNSGVSLVVSDVPPSYLLISRRFGIFLSECVSYWRTIRFAGLMTFSLYDHRKQCKRNQELVLFFKKKNITDQMSLFGCEPLNSLRSSGLRASPLSQLCSSSERKTNKQTTNIYKLLPRKKLRVTRCAFSSPEFSRGADFTHWYFSLVRHTKLGERDCS